MPLTAGNEASTATTTTLEDVLAVENSQAVPTIVTRHLEVETDLIDMFQARGSMAPVEVQGYGYAAFQAAQRRNRRTSQKRANELRNGSLPSLYEYHEGGQTRPVSSRLGHVLKPR